ncbi:hypothetical protein PPYR_04531 [Photinus pyralis]|uniref:Coiled-coil domain-containing protein 151 n=1 Tax=Photinus pyralis TaxID=7054 RepID=A0A5N4AX02_PHOPY|nr:early endosome antigen 1-like [Photinus pyralis]XP_031335144.1 early endosome antigen 1-like [Photinus pyralis]XP_031335173.1 early endosome antigen 1-like [Photinus pyralis]KAB0801892.1 hypothetical protein PPYR_04078 [Photinus pyralis]KAB0802345.1 hypothetical protein PPYR_04531 [Photinus pyralis]
MSGKHTKKSTSISDVNKHILEIKKKIQLSEGQRKALFEVREAEYKGNCNEIAKLKKEISEILVLLNEQKSNRAQKRIKSGRLKSTVGALCEKPSWITQEMLDLHVIDKGKQHDLIRYQVRQKQLYLAKLAKEYQKLALEKGKKLLIQKVEIPFKNISTELQNNMHAIKIQWREAAHVNTRYKDIMTSLQQDGARFEFNMKCIENQLCVQRTEIDRLQKIAEEASEMRGRARTALVQQEKSALNAAKSRDQQESEGRLLVEKGQQELEKLERRIFQSGKVPIRPETDSKLENNVVAEQSTPSPQNDDVIVDIFESLKQGTGATTTEEVLERFRAQRETDSRLNNLRNNSEIEKRHLEKTQEVLNFELEQHKYAETRDEEQNLEQVEQFEKLIQEQEELQKNYENQKEETKTVIRHVGACLDSLYRGIHPLSTVEQNSKMALQRVEAELCEIISELNQAKPSVKYPAMIEVLEMDEDKWLPPPYGGLVARTPVPQEESPIPQPIGSDDDEEVPTRGYLKRQAQLVVDARLRRKNIRFQRK